MTPQVSPETQVWSVFLHVSAPTPTLGWVQAPATTGGICCFLILLLPPDRMHFFSHCCISPYCVLELFFTHPYTSSSDFFSHYLISSLSRPSVPITYACSSISELTTMDFKALIYSIFGMTVL